MHFIFNGRLSREGFLIPALFVLSPYVLYLFIYPYLYLLFNSSSPFSLLSYLGYDHTVETLFVPSPFTLTSALFFFIVLPILLLPAALQRLHDMNKQGDFLLFFMIPILNIFMTLILLVVPGDTKNNKYGAVPKRHSLIPAYIVLGIIFLYITYYVLHDFSETHSETFVVPQVITYPFSPPELSPNLKIIK